MPADQPPSNLPGHEPYDPGLDARVTVLERLAFDTKAILERMDKRFDQIDRRLDQFDMRFEQIDRRLDQFDARFEQIDRRLEQVDKRFDQADTRFERIEIRIESLQSQVTRIDKEFVKFNDERTKLTTDISEIKGRISQFPTTLQLLGFILAVFAISGILHH